MELFTRIWSKAISQHVGYNSSGIMKFGHVAIRIKNIDFLFDPEGNKLEIVQTQPDSPHYKFEKSQKI